MAREDLLHRNPGMTGAKEMDQPTCRDGIGTNLRGGMDRWRLGVAYLGQDGLRSVEITQRRRCQIVSSRITHKIVSHRKYSIVR